MPWFEYFDEDKKSIEGAEALDGIKSIKDINKQKVKDLFGGASNQNQNVHDIFTTSF